MLHFEKILTSGKIPMSHLHQRLLRQFRSLKGHRAPHVGCEAVTWTRRSLEALQVGTCLSVRTVVGARRAD